MIGFTDAFLYNYFQLPSITTAHSQSTADDSLHSRSSVSVLLQILNWTERSHVSSLYVFVKDRIESTTSNSSSIIIWLFVAAETCLATCYPATDVLLLRA
jgi:hypothetical protein